MIHFDIKNIDATTNDIFKKYYLKIAGKKYLIKEIELYYKSPQHSDPYVHCDIEQENNNTFYFHRYFGKGLKDGTYKGLDITIGGGNGTKIYGGFLIRSIYSFETKKIIEGPCLVVNEIINQNGYEQTDLKKFYDKFKSENDDFSIWNTNNMLNLSPINEPNVLPFVDIIASPRVGLGFKAPKLNEKINYVCRHYRFHDNVFKIHKQSLTIKIAKNEVDLSKYEEQSKNLDLQEIPKLEKSMKSKYLALVYAVTLSQ